MPPRRPQPSRSSVRPAAIAPPPAHGETAIGPPPSFGDETGIGPPPVDDLRSASARPPPRPAPRRSFRTAFAVALLVAVAVGLVSMRGRLEVSRLAALARRAATPTPRPIPSDPPLSGEVRELMRTGEREERDGRLARARWHYWEAFEQSGRECFSCFLKLRTLERRMVVEIDAALAAGEKDLSVGNWDEAIRQFEKVQRLDPDPESMNHRNAARGIAQAQSGKPER